MQETSTWRTTFETLPSFADFILKNCFEDYIKALGEQPLFELSVQENKAELERLVEGRLAEILSASIEKSMIEDVAIEDITMPAHTLKTVLMQFIPRFTTEPARIIALAAELDAWQFDYSTRVYRTFIDLLQRRAVELEESNANLQDFAFIASHDLKEPLRKISTLGNRLQTERTSLTVEGNVYLDKMINASIRMQQMVDDLLSLSQISADTPFEKVSLDQLLADVMQTFESRIESIGATVSAEKLPEAEVVPSLFRQLFQNLVGNALKFARKDRPLVLNVTGRRLDKIDFSDAHLRKAPSYVKLTFSDNGIGFDNKFANKIFAIFQRLNPRSEYDGAGIGLAICRKIAETHGSTIQANSSPETGSEFTIIIPSSRT